MITKKISDSKIEMRELVLPNDTNQLKNLLGGKLMHLVDIAGAMVASRHANNVVVTAAIDSVDFEHPIHLGEMVILQANLTWVGRTSMEVAVCVFSENYMTGDIKFTNKAYLTFVAVDENYKPVEVPRLELETDEEINEFEAGAKRKAERIKRKKSCLDI